MTADRLRFRVLDFSSTFVDRVVGALDPVGDVVTDGEHDYVVYCFGALTDQLLRDAGFLAPRSVPVVVVVAGVPAPHCTRTLMNRAEAVIEADGVERAFARAVEVVASGGCVFPRAFRDHLARPTLTPREKQILAMVVLDLSNADIARRLTVTESGVKNHLTSAFAKLGVRSRSAAAELILDDAAGLGPGILRITPPDDGATAEP